MAEETKDKKDDKDEKEEKEPHCLHLCLFGRVRDKHLLAVGGVGPRQFLNLPSG